MLKSGNKQWNSKLISGKLLKKIVNIIINKIIVNYKILHCEVDLFIIDPILF